MSQYNYSMKEYKKEHMARVVGRDMPISIKQTQMISNAIRNKNIAYAKKYLAEVIDKKRAVKFTKFNMDMGHKTKIGPGRYPMKACGEILKLIASLESNAQFKGLNTADLYISHIIPQKAAAQYRHGRRYGRKAKSTHLEMVVEERKPEAKK